MHRLLWIYTTSVLVLIGLFCPIRSFAEFSLYNCEAGLQIGGSYYVGECARVFDFDKLDQQTNSFANIREVFGAQLRYKFDQRWSIQAKGQWQQVKYTYLSCDYNIPITNIDATAEFNFFRFGRHPYDLRVKPITPFLFLGVGISLNKKSKLDETKPISAYIPSGIGVKWMFASRWQLQAVWQQQVYITSIGDRIEGNPELDNSYDLNGNNIMNNDLTSSITIGLVFEFWKKGDMCLHCED